MKKPIMLCTGGFAALAATSQAIADNRDKFMGAIIPVKAAIVCPDLGISESKANGILLKTLATVKHTEAEVTKMVEEVNQKYNELGQVGFCAVTANTLARNPKVMRSLAK